MYVCKVSGQLYKKDLAVTVNLSLKERSRSETLQRIHTVETK